MRIGIDARMCGPKQGGIGRYIEQLIKNLEKINGEDEFVIFLRKENWDEYTPSKPNFKKVLADIPWYGWREQTQLPKIIKREKIDLMHFPHWNVPLFCRAPFIVTIHDLLLLHFPTRAASTLGPLSYFFKNLTYKIVLCSSARRAKRILTVSEFTKQEIDKTLKIPAEKIIVTHLAPHQLTTDYGLRTTDHKQRAVDRRPSTVVQITKPYVLYVGNAYPHKNLEGLLSAWKIFNKKYGNNYQLVLAGHEDYFYKKLLASLPACRLAGSGVVFVGFVPDADLPALYQNASLYVFPSFYEGFGLPPLEAITYGVPVASSDRTSLKEVLQDAAIYFNPENEEEMAEAIQKGLKDENLRQNIIKNGLKLLKRYSWEKTAAETLGVYQKCG